MSAYVLSVHICSFTTIPLRLHHYVVTVIHPRESGTAMHGFISSTRAPRCSPHPKAETTYSLLKF
ncbi:unnamed protein product [Brassica rapa subsp. trilocularis]